MVVARQALYRDLDGACRSFLGVTSSLSNVRFEHAHDDHDDG